MSDMWRKIVEVVRKTGDRCIVFDPINEEVFVLMDFASYEKFLDLKPVSKLPNLTQKTEPANIEPEFIPRKLEPELGASIDGLNFLAESSEEFNEDPSHFYLEPIE